MAERKRGNPHWTTGVSGNPSGKTETLARKQLNTVVGQVMAETGVSYQEITGPIRVENIIRAKQRAMLLLVQAGWKQKEIAKVLGCDRSSVRHGLRQAEKNVDGEMP